MSQNISDTHTIEYYNRNAQDYFQNTVSVDMSEICDRFLIHVQPGGSIIDIGAGSGRDLKYFIEKGYAAEGLDASAEMCHLAAAYAGAEVTCAKIQEWNPVKQYGGIWANASLVHLTPEEIADFIHKLPERLTENGVVYASFKTGIETGEDNNGRFFANVTEDWIQETISCCENLKIIDIWNTADQMGRNDLKWINVIFGKV